jgi:hypothetical protein
MMGSWAGPAGVLLEVVGKSIGPQGYKWFLAQASKPGGKALASAYLKAAEHGPAAVAALHAQMFPGKRD